jgi:hypothetical protein
MAASQTRSTATVPQTAAAGGLLFTQPPQTAAPSYYKISPDNPVTFGWNYTSVIVFPETLHISAYCQSNGNSYPVGPTESSGVFVGAPTEVSYLTLLIDGECRVSLMRLPRLGRLGSLCV